MATEMVVVVGGGAKAEEEDEESAVGLDAANRGKGGDAGFVGGGESVQVKEDAGVGADGESTDDVEGIFDGGAPGEVRYEKVGEARLLRGGEV